MAYNEAIFTQLGQVLNPDANQAEGMADKPNLFELDQTNKSYLKDAMASVVKKEQEQKSNYEKELSKVLTATTNIGEGLSIGDYNVLKEEGNQILKEFYNNPKALLGQDSQKALELNQRLANFTAKVNLSKNTKKVGDVYFEFMKAHPDEYDNEVNKSTYESYINLPIEERAQKVFVPIRNNEKDFVQTLLPKYLETQGDPIPSGEVDKIEGDDAVYIMKDGKRYDYTKFLDFYESNMGRYDRQNYRNNKSLQDTYESEDEYINQRAQTYFAEETIKNKIRFENLQIKAENEQKKEETLAKGRENVAEINAKSRVDAAREKYNNTKIDSDINNYPLVKMAQGKWTNFNQNTTNVSVKMFGNLFPNLTKVEKLTNLPNEIQTQVYGGGEDKIGSNELYKITTKDGDVRYYKTKVQYFTSSGSPTTATDKYKPYDPKKTTIGIDTQTSYTDYNLFSSLINTQKSKIEYQLYLDAKKEEEKAKYDYDNAVNEDKASQTTSGSLIGITQIAFNPLGYGYKGGSRIEGYKLSGHDNHAHIVANDPQVMLSIMKEANKRGINISENVHPLGGGKVGKGVHEEKGGHYTIIGKDEKGNNISGAIDIGTSAKGVQATKDFVKWIESTFNKKKSTDAKPRESMESFGKII